MILLILLKLWQVLIALLGLPFSILTWPFYRKTPELPLTICFQPRERQRDYRLSDPYAPAGNYYLAQLHIHTNRSHDGFWSRKEATKCYTQLGYKILAFADHDKINKRLSKKEGLLIIPAEEHTFPRPFKPLGPHAVILFSRKYARALSFAKRLNKLHQQKAMVNMAHPSWVGSLGQGQWQLNELFSLHHRFQLMEICSSKSDPAEDTLRWHQLISYLGPDRPIWATGGDDSHSKDFYHYCWLNIKTSSLDLDAVQKALEEGSFYPTMGPIADFSTQENKIVVKTEEKLTINFIAGLGPDTPPQIVATAVGKEASYLPKGDEHFVRVEVVAEDGKKAWSQPFWLLPAEDSSKEGYAV